MYCPKSQPHALDIFAGLVYNKNNKEMPTGNRHLPVVEARRLPLHMYSVSRETSPQRVSRLLEADGSLLFIAQIQHERHDTGNRAQSSKDSQIEAFERLL